MNSIHEIQIFLFQWMSSRYQLLRNLQMGFPRYNVVRGEQMTWISSTWLIYLEDTRMMLSPENSGWKTMFFLTWPLLGEMWHFGGSSLCKWCLLFSVCLKPMLPIFCWDFPALVVKEWCETATLTTHKEGKFVHRFSSAIFRRIDGDFQLKFDQILEYPL